MRPITAEMMHPIGVLHDTWLIRRLFAGVLQASQIPRYGIAPPSQIMLGVLQASQLLRYGIAPPS